MFVQAFHGRTIIISVWTNLVFFVLKAKKKIRKVEWRADPVNFVEPALRNSAVASLRTNRSFVISTDLQGRCSARCATTK